MDVIRACQGFQVTTSSGKSYTLGLHEMGGSNTADLMQSFNHLVEELANAVTSGTNDKSDKIAHLTASIKNTMSDQGSVNPVFNEQLRVMREEALSSILDDWEHMSPEAQSSISSLGNFVCKMHLLVNFASECDKTLQIFEKVAKAEDVAESVHVMQTAESGAARLVRTSVKAFHPHGSEAAVRCIICFNVLVIKSTHVGLV
jgi:hypothetical protein